MVDHPDKAPVGPRPAFERLTEACSRLLVRILGDEQISIPQALIKEYLGKVDPEIEEFTALIDSVRLAALEGESYIQAASILDDLEFPDDDDNDPNLLLNEGSLLCVPISTLRAKYLLHHAAEGVPIGVLVNNIKLRLAEIVAEISGRGNHDLPEAWISSLTRGRIDELMKKGEQWRRETAYEEVDEAKTHRRVEEITSLMLQKAQEAHEVADIENFKALVRRIKADAKSSRPQWIEELHDSDTRIIDYVTANPDPGPFVDKLLDIGQLRILGQIAAKKPLS